MTTKKKATNGYDPEHPILVTLEDGSWVRMAAMTGEDYLAITESDSSTGALIRVIAASAGEHSFSKPSLLAQPLDRILEIGTAWAKGAKDDAVPLEIGER